MSLAIIENSIQNIYCIAYIENTSSKSTTREIYMTPSLANYTLNEKIYEGRYCYVYRSVRHADQMPVILKLLKGKSPSPMLQAQMRHEYSIMQQLKTPRVIQAYGIEEDAQQLMIVMEDFGGVTLSTLLQDNALDLKTFFTIAIELAAGLGDIHHRHIIHKDIKPQNIVVNLKKGQTKIIDFGIATILSREEQQIANPNIMEGTAAYISPEQTGRMNRAIDYRTDIYSLGITLYEMATHQVPFASTDFQEIVHQHIAKAPKPPHVVNPELPEALSGIILKCLEKGAEERYHSAYGLKNDLEECLRQLDLHGSIPYFAPGQHDIYDQFQIPQKLYGREKEINALLSIFERSSQGLAQILLVKGYAGIGKSSLVNEIQKPIVQKKGNFIFGKFDQFKKDIPYSALIQAFQGLVQQLLAKGEQELQLWKTHLTNALGQNGQVIIAVIPDMKCIIGEQPPISKLDDKNAQIRFQLTFASFIEAFLHEEQRKSSAGWANWLRSKRSAYRTMSPT